MKETINSRNSWLRRVTRNVRAGMTEKIDRFFPRVHPNDLTKGRGVIFSIGASWAFHKRGIGPGLLIGGAALTDAFDGELARYKGKKDPGWENHTGWFLDTGIDRWQEGLAASLRAMRAFERGERAGGCLALLTMVTNPLTALMRKWAERQGVEVAEFPKGPLFTFPIRILGNHAGRMAKETALAVIDSGGIEKSLDILTIGGNFYTFFNRLRSLREGKDRRELSKEDRREENKKLVFLAGITGLTLAVAGKAFLLGTSPRHTR